VVEQAMAVLNDNWPPAQPKHCPVCARPLETTAHKPFCSDRCRNRDLHRWLAEGYAIAGVEAPRDREDLES
jgi:uncharacterized protein